MQNYSCFLFLLIRECRQRPDVISAGALFTRSAHSHSFVCTSSLFTSNISISLMIRSAMVLLFAQIIRRDIRSKGPPKRQSAAFSIYAV